MTIERLKKELHKVIERYSHRVEFFGEVRRDDMARDCLSAIEELEAENAELKRKLYVNDGETTRLLNRINNFKTDEANVQNLLNDCYVMLHKQMTTISKMENVDEHPRTPTTEESSETEKN